MAERLITLLIPAKGFERELLIGEIDQLLKKNNFGVLDFNQFTINMICLLGAVRKEALKDTEEESTVLVDAEKGVTYTFEIYFIGDDQKEHCIRAQTNGRSPIVGERLLFDNDENGHPEPWVSCGVMDCTLPFTFTSVFIGREITLFFNPEGMPLGADDLERPISPERMREICQDIFAVWGRQ